MDLSTCDHCSPSTEIANLGAPVADISLTGNYPSLVLKIPSEKLQPSHGIVIMSSDADNHQRINAIYRVIDSHGAILAKSFNSEDPFPKLCLLDNVSQEVLVLNATGVQALIVSDPENNDVYKHFVSPTFHE